MFDDRSFLVSSVLSAETPVPMATSSENLWQSKMKLRCTLFSIDAINYFPSEGAQKDDAIRHERQKESNSLPLFTDIIDMLEKAKVLWCSRNCFNTRL